MCYDRLTDGLMPACATACPTQSIQFGDLDELQARADARLATLKSQGVETARLYGRDENDGVGGNGAFFLLLDEPRSTACRRTRSCRPATCRPCGSRPSRAPP